MAKYSENFYKAIYGRNWPVGFHRYESSSTKKANGSIDMRAQNRYDFSHCMIKSLNIDAGPSGVPIYPAMTTYSLVNLKEYSSALASANNEAHAKFYGKIRYGSASLGITLTQWRQTSAMITHRSRAFAKTLDSAYEALRGNRSALKRLRNEREPLANQVLEGFFGWSPLMSDVKAATETAIQLAIPDDWMKATARRYLVGRHTIQKNPYGHYYCDIEGTLSFKYTGNVQISNPNLYLAHRLGLIDLPTVAWDLVPWSFVVNWFVNSAQLIGSLSSDVGLTITNESTMLKHSAFLKGYQHGVSAKQTTRSEYFTRVKQRRVNARPKLSVEFKTPDFSWDLAAIASSLVVQKLKRINALIRVI